MAERMLVPERAMDYRIYSNEGSERADSNLSQSPSFGSSTEENDVSADVINKRKYTLNDWWAAAEEETTHPEESDADPFATLTEYDSTGSPPNSSAVMLPQASKQTSAECEPEMEPQSGCEGADEPSEVFDTGAAAVISHAVAESTESQRGLVPRIVITGEEEGSSARDDLEHTLIRRPAAADRRAGAAEGPEDKTFWDFFWMKLNASCCMSEA